MITDAVDEPKVTPKQPRETPSACISVWALIGAFAIGGQAHAAAYAEIGGGAQSPVVGGGYQGTPSCTYGDAGTPSIVGFCATDAVAVDAFNVVAYSGSSVDSNGLHAITRSEIFATSTDYYKSGIFPALSNASASLQDMLHFSDAAPIVGYADITLSAIGNIGVGGSMTSQLTVSDGTSTTQYDSCFFGFAGGSCTVKLLVHFADGVGVYDGISVFANATIGQGYGSAATSITNFQDTAFISAVQFTDVAGNPIELSYVTDSGYQYPQASTVPEPATWLLWLAALPMLLSVSRRRN